MNMQETMQNLCTLIVEQAQHGNDVEGEVIFNFRGMDLRVNVRNANPPEGLEITDEILIKFD